jgi:hypothetical protein
MVPVSADAVCKDLIDYGNVIRCAPPTQIGRMTIPTPVDPTDASKHSVKIPLS